MNGGRIVIIQTVDGPKTRSQRRRDQRQAGGRADDREARQLQANGARRRTLANHDIQGEIFHRRVHHLFHGPAQAVNFVNEKDVPRAQVSQNGRQVTGSLDRRAGRSLDIHTHLVGQDVRQGGLAQSRRAVKKHMLQWVAALACRRDQNVQIFFNLRLPNIIRQARRAQGGVNGLVSTGLWVHQAILRVGHEVDYTHEMSFREHPARSPIWLS